MQIFCPNKPDKKGIKALFEGVLPRGLEDLANLADDDERPLDGVEQFFGPESHHGIRLRWVGVRTNDAGRLLGAVVKIKGKGRYFFALDYTPDHHYEDTFVEKTELLPGLRALILAYVGSMTPGVEAGSGGASGYGRFDVVPVTYHKRRYVRLDTTQLELTRMDLREGVVCFSPPGVGKTLIAVERAKAYLAAGLRVAFVLPTQALADDVRGEFISQEIELSDTGLNVFSLDEYLSYMGDFYPELGPAYDAATDRRQLVDEAFFSGWMKIYVRKGELPSLADSIYWQEFCDVFMRPNWNLPELAHRDVEGYVEKLGTSQSNIEKEDRAKVHKVFARFFAQISDNEAYYFPLLRAQQLYSRQVREGASAKFDAVVIDEIQRFKPWEWASILMLLEGSLYEGQYLLFGDAYQGGSLWLAQVLKTYFMHYGIAELPLRHLLVNHRNAQAVSRFVQLIHRTEESMLGAMEKDTHTSDASLSDNKEQGQVIVTPYDREQIKADADAYVVIPDESCRAAAELLWSRGQIVSLLEFTGLSAKTVVMYGFSAHYKTALKAIHATAEALPPEAFLGDGSFSRKSKGDEKPLLRACMQAMYTAASRAEMTLILDEPVGTRIHPFFIKTLKQATPVEAPAMPMTGAGASAGSVVMTGAGGPGGGASAAAVSLLVDDAPAASFSASKPSSTPMDWFSRVETDFRNNLIKQAENTLEDATKWGDAGLHARILGLKGEGPLSIKVLQAIRALLEMEAKPASAVVASSAHEIVKVPVLVKAEVKRDLLNKDMVEYTTRLLKNITPGNLINLFGKSDKLIKKYLFHDGQDNVPSFLLKMIYFDKVNIFCDSTNYEQRGIMKRIYDSIESPGILLHLCWLTLQDKWSIQSREKKKRSQKKSPSDFEKLMKKLGSDGDLLFELLNSIGGAGWLYKHWPDFRTHLTSDALFQACTGDCPEQGKSPFFLLTIFDEGRQILFDYWADFHRHLTSPGFSVGLFQACTGDCPEQGMSPFFLLTILDEGRQILSEHWTDFRAHLTSDRLFQTCAVDGTSPFSWLLSAKKGRQILRKHWADFYEHFTAEGLGRFFPDKKETDHGMISVLWDYLSTADEKSADATGAHRFFSDAGLASAASDVESIAKCPSPS